MAFDNETMIEVMAMKTLALRAAVATVFLGFVSTGSLLVSTAHAGIIILDNTGSPSTGDNLDEINSVPTTVDVEEISGLTLTVTAIAGDDTSGTNDVNSTGTSLGINSGVGGDDTDAFDAGFSESLTIRFNQAVNITQLDFTAFELGDTFNFAGTIINNGDLSSGTTDIFDFGIGGLNIAANTPFTLQATAGTIGIEAITLTVVPEPSTLLLAIGGLLGVCMLRRRR